MNEFKKLEEYKLQEKQKIRMLIEYYENMHASQRNKLATQLEKTN